MRDGRCAAARVPVALRRRHEGDPMDDYFPVVMLPVFERILVELDLPPDLGSIRADSLSDYEPMLIMLARGLEVRLPGLRPGPDAEFVQHAWSLLWRMAAIGPLRGQPLDELRDTLAPTTRAHPALLYEPAFDALAWEWLPHHAQLGLGPLPEDKPWPERVIDQPRDVIRFIDRLRDEIVKWVGRPPAAFNAREHLVMLFFDRRSETARQAKMRPAQQPKEPPQTEPTTEPPPSAADAYQDYVASVLLRRYRMRRRYEPTGQKILLSNSCATDYPLRITSQSLDELIPLAARALGLEPHDVARMISAELRRREDLLFDPRVDDRGAAVKAAAKLEDKVGTLAQALVGTLAYARLSALLPAGGPSSRFEISGADKEQVWDAIDGLLARAEPGELGGGSAAGAAALAAQGEKQVDLAVAFLQPILSRALEDGVRVLWHKGPKRHPELYRISQRDFQRASSGQPESRNPILEFTAGREIVYCHGCGAGVTPRKTDRTIMRNSLMWYRADGAVDRNASQALGHALAVNGFFTFDNSLCPELNTQSLAHQAAAIGYDLFLVSGLQNLGEDAHDTAVAEIRLLRDAGARVHVEIGGDKKLDRLFTHAALFDSLGIGEELGDARRTATALAEGRVLAPGERDALDKALDGERVVGYRRVIQALRLARDTGIPRIYYHGEDFDIIVRRGNLAPDERLREIEACLVAKWVVLRKLMSRNVVTTDMLRDPQTELKQEGLAAIAATVGEIKARFPKVKHDIVELDGAYLDEYDATLIVIPVRWVYGNLQSLLRIVGAGDASSFIDAARALKGLTLRSEVNG
jgi:hypothetical protein